MPEFLIIPGREQSFTPENLQEAIAKLCSKAFEQAVSFLGKNLPFSAQPDIRLVASLDLNHLTDIRNIPLFEK